MNVSSPGSFVVGLTPSIASRYLEIETELVHSNFDDWVFFDIFNFRPIYPSYTYPTSG